MDVVTVVAVIPAVPPTAVAPVVPAVDVVPVVPPTDIVPVVPAVNVVPVVAVRSEINVYAASFPASSAWREHKIDAGGIGQTVVVATHTGSHQPQVLYRLHWRWVISVLHTT